jgi:predicted nucleic acid-binding protein
MGTSDSPAAVESDVMPELLVDTDILIDFSRGMSATAQYLDQTSQTTTLAISCITHMELIVGCVDKQALRTIERFVTRFQILPLTPEISQKAIELLRQYKLSHNLLIPDALIASTALAFGIPLGTRNQRDFRFIPDLVLAPPP